MTLSSVLPKSFRLTKQDKIEYIVKCDPVFKNFLFVIKRRINQKKHHRFCIVISRKFSLNSVDRNKLRRRIYEAIRLYLKTAARSDHHYDYAIMVRQPALSSSYQDIAKNFIHALNANRYTLNPSSCGQKIPPLSRSSSRLQLNSSRL